MKIKNYSTLLIIAILCLSIFQVGCSTNKSLNKHQGLNENSSTKENLSTVATEKGPKDKNPIATIKMENGDLIKIELFPEIAPNTVRNFISLANNNFYNGLTFHRIIPKFMIQGGDPKGNGTGGPGYTIAGEFKSNGFNNTLTHTKGVISMARSKDKNSAGSQFFIMHGDAPHLDGEYAAFGKVIEGVDIIDKIANTKTSSGDKPIQEVKIQTITIDTFGVKYQDVVKYTK